MPVFFGSVNVSVSYLLASQLNKAASLRLAQFSRTGRPPAVGRPARGKYVVSGKPAIEWIMDRYQVKQGKKSGIINDPNDWSEEVGNPRYILDLLLSIINVSVQTVEIVEGLPELEFG